MEATLLKREDTVSKAIDEYNEYRSPEIEASLTKIDESAAVIEFTGTFCQTCGFYDYFEDFRLVLENDFGLKTEIGEIEELVSGGVVEFNFSESE